MVAPHSSDPAGVTSPLTRLVPPQTSLAVRLAWASAAAGLAIGSIAIAIAYVSLSRQLSERVQVELEGKQVLVLRVLSGVDSAEGIHQVVHRLFDCRLTFPGYMLLLCQFRNRFEHMADFMQWIMGSILIIFRERITN